MALLFCNCNNADASLSYPVKDHIFCQTSETTRVFHKERSAVQKEGYFETFLFGHDQMMT